MVSSVSRLTPVAPLAASFGSAGDDTPELAASTATSHEVFELVYRQMRKLVGPRHRTHLDELVQIASEQALRSLPSFEGRSSLATWTFRICYVTVRKYDRWYSRWLRRFSLTSDGEVPEAPIEPEGDVRLVQAERIARLHAALDRLSVKQRTVVVLHDLEGLSIDDVAAVVEALPAAVRSRLRDGRKALAAALALDPYFGDEACSREERS